MSDVAPAPGDGPNPATPPGSLDYDLVDEIDGRTAERHRALGDPVRLLVLDLVLERAMTVTELAERIGKAKGTIAHHVDVLVAAGLLQVVRTRRVRAVEERFYGRVARTIIVPSRAGELPFAREAIQDADLAAMESDETGGGFTLRHARISRERADEFTRRLFDLTIEFTAAPREGDVEYAVYVGVFPTNRRIAPNDAIAVPSNEETTRVRHRPH
jgi:DNA-binding transcriptional ArsR family regulator